MLNKLRNDVLEKIRNQAILIKLPAQWLDVRWDDFASTEGFRSKKVFLRLTSGERRD
jgi:hypothetical protein